MMKKIYLLFLSIALCLNLQSQIEITVNPTTEYQTIWGFGGNGEGDATYMKYVIDLMGMSAYRHYMDAGTNYMTGSGGSGVTAADINGNSVTYKVSASTKSFMTAIKAKGVTNIMMTSWSPPAALKQNNCMCQKYLGLDANCCQGTAACGSYNCADDNNYLKSEYYDEYGKALAGYVKEFETQTTQKVYAINIQNEPLFNEPYSSGILTAQTFGPCLQKVKTEFTNAGLTTKFHGPEHMVGYSRNAGGDGERSKYVQNLLWDPTYRSLLDIYSVHGYTDGIAADAGNDATWYALDTAVRKWGKDLMLTETDFQGTASWDVAFNMTQSIYNALKSGNANGWIYWGMNGTNGMYTGGSSTPRLYACMHYFRFIRPGYKRIACSETDSDLATVAFKNGTDITVVVINNSTTKSKTVNFKDFTSKPAFFHMYRSSSTEQCAYVGKISTNTFELTPKSIATLYYKASEPDVVFGPSAPQNLQATVIGDDNITVTWSPTAAWTLAGSPVSISGYVVYINGVKKTPDGPTTKTTWTFTGLKKNTVYKIEIYSRDAMINQSPASAISVVTTCSTNDCGPVPDPDPDPISIDESISSFMVSPNPVSNALTITLPDQEQFTLQFISLSGQIVLTQENVVNNTTIDVSAITAGAYIVIAKNKDKVLKTKIIKE